MRRIPYGAKLQFSQEASLDSAGKPKRKSSPSGAPSRVSKAPKPPVRSSDGGGPANRPSPVSEPDAEPGEDFAGPGAESDAVAWEPYYRALSRHPDLLSEVDLDNNDKGQACFAVAHYGINDGIAGPQVICAAARARHWPGPPPRGT